MSDPQPSDDPLARYARQVRFAPLGEAGQQALLAGRALVCGCGALGSVIANTLARAGVGYLRIVDRDFLELNNLQRQVLFDEDDLAAGLPKAIAATAKLRRINSQVTIDPHVVDLTPANILELAADIDVIVDGTDNFETRYLMNEAAVKLNIPWVYGGCIGGSGQTMTIVPGDTPCLRCILPEAPPAGSTPTCDTAGILGPAAAIVASLQAAEVIKLLAGPAASAAINRSLTMIDAWTNEFRRIKLDRLREQGGCPTCKGSDFPWLDGRRGMAPAILCGRNAVQVSPAAENSSAVSLEALAEKLSGLGTVTRNAYLLRARLDPYVLTIFPDGRAIVAGTDDVSEARSVYARYIGN